MTKAISVSLSVQKSAVQHDFNNSQYYFALDKNKVSVSKTSAASSYVKMTLDLYYKGFGAESREIQTYTFPFFRGVAEIFPGEEIQDFFVKAKDLSAVSEPQYLYDLAVVSMNFQEMDASDAAVSTFTLTNLKFAPGRKPKCFPFFTDHAVRRTFSGSILKIAVDSASEKPAMNALFADYTVPLPVFTQKFAVQRFTFERKLFRPELQKKVILNDLLTLYPLPDPEEIAHIEWENQNLVFDWFTAVAKYKETAELEVISGESKTFREEKFGGNFTKTITVNTGWILREEIDLITDLLLSRLCFITIGGRRFRAFPIGKKNDLKDSENQLFSMGLDFKILIEK